MKLFLTLLHMMFVAMLYQPATASTHGPPSYAAVTTGKPIAIIKPACVMPQIAAQKRLNLFRTRQMVGAVRMAQAVGFVDKRQGGAVAGYDYKDDPHIG